MSNVVLAFFLGISLAAIFNHFVVKRVIEKINAERATINSKIQKLQNANEGLYQGYISSIRLLQNIIQISINIRENLPELTGAEIAIQLEVQIHKVKIQLEDYLKQVEKYE